MLSQRWLDDAEALVRSARSGDLARDAGDEACEAQDRVESAARALFCTPGKQRHARDRHCTQVAVGALVRAGEDELVRRFIGRGICSPSHSPSRSPTPSSPASPNSPQRSSAVDAFARSGVSCGRPSWLHEACGSEPASPDSRDSGDGCSVLDRAEAVLREHGVCLRREGSSQPCTSLVPLQASRLVRCDEDVLQRRLVQRLRKAVEKRLPSQILRAWKECVTTKPPACSADLLLDEAMQVIAAAREREAARAEEQALRDSDREAADELAAGAFRRHSLLKFAVSALSAEVLHSKSLEAVVEELRTQRAHRRVWRWWVRAIKTFAAALQAETRAAERKLKLDALVKGFSTARRPLAETGPALSASGARVPCTVVTATSTRDLLPPAAFVTAGAGASSIAVAGRAIGTGHVGTAVSRPADAILKTTGGPEVSTGEKSDEAGLIETTEEDASDVGSTQVTGPVAAGGDEDADCVPMAATAAQTTTQRACCPGPREDEARACARSSRRVGTVQVESKFVESMREREAARKTRRLALQERYAALEREKLQARARQEQEAVEREQMLKRARAEQGRRDRQRQEQAEVERQLGQELHREMERLAGMHLAQQRLKLAMHCWSRAITNERRAMALWARQHRLGLALRVLRQRVSLACARNACGSAIRCRVAWLRGLRMRARVAMDVWSGVVVARSKRAAGVLARRMAAAVGEMLCLWRELAACQAAARTAQRLHMQAVAQERGLRAVMRRSVVRWREAAVEERNERARSQFRSELRKTATQTLRWIRDKDGDERGAIAM